tara:strand:+ start:446 stop:631 length:186 start_codon:yes stop_codon:yes gene_type:complete
MNFRKATENDVSVIVEMIADDDCEALIEKNFYFDISNLQVNNESKVLLNFQGSSLTYLYEY